MSDDKATAMAVPAAYEPNWGQLEGATNENPFMTAGVELLKEAATLTLMTAGVSTEHPYDRDEAIDSGLLVRAGRLARSTLRDVCEGDGEQQLGMFRQLMDTGSSLRYLLDDKDGSRHTAFVQDSLVAEREFLKKIDQQQKATGQALAIEKRIQQSIEQSSQAAGESLDALPSRKAIGWPNAGSRAQAFGPTAYPAYRMGSASLHGTWHDIYRNYLDEVEGGFRPRFEPLRPRPQPLLASVLLLSDATASYLEGRPRTERNLLQPAIKGVLERANRVDELHEAFIQRRPDSPAKP